MFTPTYIWKVFKRKWNQFLAIAYILYFHFVCLTFHINSILNRMYSVPLLHVFNKFTIYWIIRVWLDFNTCTFIFDFYDYNKKNLTLTCHNFGQLSLFFYLLLSEYCQQPVCENQLKKKNKINIQKWIWNFT